MKPCVPERAGREYKQHRPEETPLFPLVRDNLEGFLAQCRAVYRSGVPRYVEKELREYLECGIHAHGFARAVCGSCGHELLLAFSCKRRGVCPSCNARRMSDTAARLIDTVLPPVRLRQWVLSVPYDLRVILAKNPAALSTCGRLFVEEIFRWQRLIGAWRGLVPLAEAHRALRGGAVSFPQRFGGSLNLNVHYHVVVPDAVFFRDTDGHIKRELLPAPSKSDLHDVAQSLSVRVLRYLTREGLIADAGSAPEESGSEPSAIEACVQSSIGLGNLATVSGDKVKRTAPHSSASVSRRARGGEFNIHASVTATATEDRERLVRYCARAPLSLDRLSVSRCGKVVYQLRHPIGKKTHRVMEPYQFLARLCALIPPPRHPLIRFHGVLAPNSAWRKAVVPQHPPSEALSAQGPAQTSESASGDPATERAWEASRLDWAALLKRVYNIDVLACHCGGRLTFIELIESKREAVAQLIARGLPVEGSLLPRSPPSAASDYLDEVPETDWDQSSHTPSFVSDPIWDDP